MFDSENLQYLLWSRNIPRSAWRDTLSQWAQVDLQRAKTLLEGATLSGKERKNIAKVVMYQPEILTEQRLIQVNNINILHENLICLLDALAYGQKRLISQYLNVHPSTISRWISSDQAPSREHLRELVRYFGIPEDVDLVRDALFLGLLPFSPVEQRHWLTERIQKLDTERLQKLFTKMVQLLEE